MELKQLFTDGRAASPVVGVILLVAITIILGSVIGSSLLGLSQNVEEEPPNAQFIFDYGQSYADGEGDTNNDGLQAEFDSGDKIQRNQLRILVDGRNLLALDGSIDGSKAGIVQAGTGDAAEPSSGPLTAGDTYVIVENSDTDDSWIEHGDPVRIVWEGTSGGKTATIAKSEVYF